jgi:hypothetical protein
MRAPHPGESGGGPSCGSSLAAARANVEMAERAAVRAVKRIQAEQKKRKQGETMTTAPRSHPPPRRARSG